MNEKCYQGRDESRLILRAKADIPEGFEIVSIARSGFLWWRKSILMVRPLPRDPRQELRRIRLLSAIYSLREQRQQQQAQRDVMTHAHDFIQQNRR